MWMTLGADLAELDSAKKRIAYWRVGPSTRAAGALEASLLLTATTQWL